MIMLDYDIPVAKLGTIKKYYRGQCVEYWARRLCLSNDEVLFAINHLGLENDEKRFFKYQLNHLKYPLGRVSGLREVICK